MKNRNKKGFTLIELIIVIAILGVLSAILVVSLTPTLNQSKEDVDKVTALGVASKLEMALIEECQAGIDDTLTQEEIGAVISNMQEKYASLGLVGAAAPLPDTAPSTSTIYYAMYIGEDTSNEVTTRTITTYPSEGFIRPGIITVIPHAEPGYKLLGMVIVGDNGYSFKVTHTDAGWAAEVIE